MKFAHYIQGLERDCPPEWRGRFIRYKDLKKLLKPCTTDGQTGAMASCASVGKAGDDAQSAEDAFFSALDEQMVEVDRSFMRQAQATIHAFERGQLRRTFLCLFLRHRYAADAKLAEQAYWCRKFAKANAVALRKILKKHDKLARNTRGRQFLQEAWQTHGTAWSGEFLHSPLLDELKAIQDVLEEQRPRDAAKRGSGGSALEDDRSSLLDEQPQCRKPGTATASAAAGSPATPTTAVLATALQGHPPPQQESVVGNPGGAAVKSPFDTPPAMNTPGTTTLASPSIRNGPSTVDGGGPATAVRVGPSTPPGAPHVPARLNRLSAALSFVTSSSLRAQRDEGLAAICESPSFLLDSSDMEWEGLGANAPVHSLDPIPSLPTTDEPGSPQPGLGDGGEGMGRDAFGNGHHEEAVENSGLGNGGATATGFGEDANIAAQTTGNVAGKTSAPGPSAMTSSASSQAQTTSGARFHDADLTCPICLDMMYKPVALACGHKFCKRCALSAAGFGRAVGTFASVCSHVPRRTVCPECRQPDVYRRAVSLRGVGRLIAARHPEQWDARRRAEKELERAAAERMLEKARDTYRPVLRASSVYELLF